MGLVCVEPGLNGASREARSVYGGNRTCPPAPGSPTRQARGDHSVNAARQCLIQVDSFRRRWQFRTSGRRLLPSKRGIMRRARRGGVIIGVMALVWLLIGVVAAWQRGYFRGFDMGDTNCATAATIARTVITGPLNY